MYIQNIYINMDTYLETIYVYIIIIYMYNILMMKFDDIDNNNIDDMMMIM